MPNPNLKRGPGRPKGSSNKITSDMRDIIRQAFDEAGGVEYLKEIAVSDPKTFLTLVGKIVPAEIRADIEATGNMILNIVTGVPRSDEDTNTSDSE
jgi:hypothetical protein